MARHTSRLSPLRLSIVAATVVAAASLVACAPLRPPVAPMPTLRLERAAGAPLAALSTISTHAAHATTAASATEAPRSATTDCLVVLLPGRYDDMGDFADAGFAAAAAERGLAVDLVAADAHLGYYFARTVVGRLHEDVVAPARAHGYRHLWLAGTSLGGLGSLLYLRDRPDEVEGVLVIAPYLGEAPIVDEVERAGGAARWYPPAAVETADFERQLWTVLGEWARSGGPPAPVWLGFGSEDPYVRSHRLLASILPRERVLVVEEGAHDWDTWAQLWREFLSRGALDGCIAPRAAAGR